MKITLLIVSLIMSAFNVKDTDTTAHYVKKVKSNPAVRTHISGIFGGTEAKEGAFGFQAALYMNTGAFCGGSLIGAYWVLTAAHCLTDATSVEVILGTLDGETGSTFWSTDIIIHGMYNEETLEHDIGLVRLFTEAPTKSKLIRTIKLQVRTKSCAEPNRKLTATDWGYCDNSDTRPVLQSVSQEEITNADCYNAYIVGEIPPTVMCAKGPPKNPMATVCSGGSPLFSGSGTGATLVGIASFEVTCGDGIPSGFTRVGFYIDWITRKTGLVFK